MLETYQTIFSPFCYFVYICLAKVAHAIDDVSHTIRVFLDFAKALDTIDHEMLLF